MEDAGPPRGGPRDAPARGTGGARTLGAGLGLRPRGLQRRRRRLGLVPARPRPLARVPLERGRDGRHLGRVRAAQPGPGAVERPGPDPQGADVRADQQRGQPRRGRQGVLVVPRRGAQQRLAALALPLPAGGLPVRATWSRRTRRRSKLEPEYELLDTGIFDDDRYWIVEVHYAKADPTDILARITVRNVGPEAADAPRPADALVPQRVVVGSRRRRGRRSRPDGRRRRDPRVAPGARRRTSSTSAPAPDGDAARAAVLRERDERAADLRDGRRPRRGPRTASTTTSWRGAATVNPDGTGTKAAAWYRLTVAARRDRRAAAAAPAAAAERAAAARARPSGLLGDVVRRRRCAQPRGGGRRVLRRTCAGPDATDDEAMIMRQAFAGHAVEQAVLRATTSPAGSTATRASPPPPAERLTGRNAGWRHFDAADILSMPDKWEYPWFAAWDLAFHAITLAHVDPAFAKYQLLVMCREWFQHPNGALPAYEWSFDDVNPPVHALAALAVWQIDGAPGHRVPRADLPQAAAQLHVVAQPRGRRGQRPVLGRLPGARQPERLRPVAPAGGRQARAVRRDGVDVRLLHLDAGDGARCSRPATRPTRTC